MPSPSRLSRRQAIGAAAGVGASLAAAPVLDALDAPAAAAAPAHRAATLAVPIQLYIEGISVDATSTALIQQFLDKTINTQLKGVRALFVPQGNAAGVVSSVLAGASFPWVVSSCCTDWPVLLPFLARLDPFLAKDNINERAYWGAGQLARFRQPNGLYGLPEDAASDVYLYRQDILDQLGLPYPSPNWTWSEAETLWRKCTANVNGQWRYGTNCPFGPSTMEGLPTVVAGYGGAYMDATHTRCLLNEPACIKAGEYWFSMVWDKVATWGDGVPNPAIATGQLVFNTSADPTVLYAVTTLGNKVQWDFIPWPRFPVRAVGKLHDNFYAMLSGVPNPEIAWELLKWVAVGSEWYRFYMRIALTPPARANMMDEWYAILRSTAPILRTKNVEYWGDATLKGEGVYDFEFFQYSPTQAQDLLMTTWPNIWNRQIGVTAGFTKVAQQINALEVSSTKIAAQQAKVQSVINRDIASGAPLPAPTKNGEGTPPAAVQKGYFTPLPGGVYTLIADGADVWDPTINCVFAGTTSTAANAEFTCRVTGLANVNCPHLSQWTKAGIIACSDLSDLAAAVTIELTGENGVNMQMQTSPAGGWGSQGPSSANQATGLIGPQQLTLPNKTKLANYVKRPVWLRLTRKGLRWTSYTSLDGKTWTQAGSPVGAEIGGVWVGLFATSHNDSFNGKGLAKATFDNVSFKVSDVYQMGKP